MDIEAVRRRLLLSIAGTFASACGPSAPDDGGGSASGAEVDSGKASTVEGDTSNGGTSNGATSNGSTSTPTSTEEASGLPVSFDVGDGVDVGGPIPTECVPQPMPPVAQCGAALPEEYPDAYFMFHCVGLPEGVTCEAWAEGFSEANAYVIVECIENECFGPYALEIGCGPLPDLGDQCCFWFAVIETQLCPGRPFVVAGRERLAEITERNDWMVDAMLATDPRSPRHAAVAAAWAEQAAFEHASIASFSRFVLQLLACGAPAWLVAAAHVALGEEIEHARLFFGFASHYAGRALGPAALATHDALVGTDDLDAALLSAVREGCIAETISAWHATIAAQSARDPAMARALARVAEQELEHAALAWEFLAWALPRASDSLRRRIAATLHDAARFAPRGPTLAATVDADEWRAHGILPADEHAAATRHALRELVLPIARSLMNAVPTRSEAPTAPRRASA